MIGALVLPAAYLVGVQWGLTGLAAAWLATYPVMLVVLASRVLPAIGASPLLLVRAVVPPLNAALAMAAVVVLVDRALPPFSPGLRLLALVSIGGVIYGGWMLAFSRTTVQALLALVRKR